MSTFVTIPNVPRVVKATEARLEKLYEAARLGLKGDSLALSAGLSPEEYRLMSDLDPMVNLVEKQARADSERTHSSMLATASLNGDAKASLAILQHQHGWQATQRHEVATTHDITIVNVLADREAQILALVGNLYEHDRTASLDNETNAGGRLLPVTTEVRSMGVPVGDGRSEGV